MAELNSLQDQNRSNAEESQSKLNKIKEIQNELRESKTEKKKLLKFFETTASRCVDARLSSANFQTLLQDIGCCTIFVRSCFSIPNANESTHYYGYIMFI